MKHEASVSIEHEPPIDGAQAVRRAIQVLQTLGHAPVHGMSLRDIVERTALNKTTAHRVLGALVESQMVARAGTGGRNYRLGPGIYALGLVAGRGYSFRDAAELPCARVCEATSDTVYLSMRNGFDSICLSRHEGAFPIRTLTLTVGSVRPLGVGAGSLALLAALPDEDVDDVLAGIGTRLSAFPHYSPEFIRDLVSDTRARGYAHNDEHLIEGMSAMGLAIHHPTGELLGAISIAALSSRMDAARQRRNYELLRSASGEIVRTLTRLEAR